MNQLQDILLAESEDSQKQFFIYFLGSNKMFLLIFPTVSCGISQAQHPHYLLQMASAEKGIN